VCPEKDGGGEGRGGKEERERERERERWRESGCPPSRNETLSRLPPSARLPLALPLDPGSRFPSSRLPLPADADAVTVVTSN